LLHQFTRVPQVYIHTQCEVHRGTREIRKDQIRLEHTIRSLFPNHKIIVNARKGVGIRSSITHQLLEIDASQSQMFVVHSLI
jgi:hypothetical protein